MRLHEIDDGRIINGHTFNEWIREVKQYIVSVLTEYRGEFSSYPGWYTSWENTLTPKAAIARWQAEIDFKNARK